MKTFKQEIRDRESEEWERKNGVLSYLIITIITYVLKVDLHLLSLHYEINTYVITTTNYISIYFLYLT